MLIGASKITFWFSTQASSPATKSEFFCKPFQLSPSCSLVFTLAVLGHTVYIYQLFSGHSFVRPSLLSTVVLYSLRRLFLSVHMFTVQNVQFSTVAGCTIYFLISVGFSITDSNKLSSGDVILRYLACDIWNRPRLRRIAAFLCTIFHVDSLWDTDEESSPAF